MAGSTCLVEEHREEVFIPHRPPSERARSDHAGSLRSRHVFLVPHRLSAKANEREDKGPGSSLSRIALDA
jgi:hypothetical protein